MQAETFEPVPFSIGGVAYAKPGPIACDNTGAAMHYGPEDAKGFRPMFFTRDVPHNEAEAQLRLDWEQAAARMIAKAYSACSAPENGHLVNLSV